VGTGPAGYYATLTALQAAYPTGDTGIYVELEYGHWYYWSGSAWIDGGLFQAPLAVVQTTGTSETDVMSQKAVTDELAKKADHGYEEGETVKTVKDVDDSIFKSKDDLLSDSEIDITRSFDSEIQDAQINQSGTITSNSYGWILRVYHYDEDYKIDYEVVGAGGSMAIMGEAPSVGTTGEVIIWDAAVGVNGSIILLKEKYLVVSYKNETTGKIQLSKITYGTSGSIAKSIEFAIAKRIGGYIVGKNKFNKNKVTNGYYNGKGEIVPASNIVYSEPIPVIGGTQMCTTEQSMLGGCYHKYFDSCGDPIGTQEATISTFIVPKNAAYMSVIVYKNLLNSFQLEIGNTQTTYESFVLTKTDAVTGENIGGVTLLNDSYGNPLELLNTSMVSKKDKVITNSYDYVISNAYINASGTILANEYNFMVRVYTVPKVSIIKYKALTDYMSIALFDSQPALNGQGTIIVSDGTAGTQGEIILKPTQYLAVAYKNASVANTEIAIENYSLEPEIVNITCSRYGTSGVDADFCGLNAIGDALASITDASPTKIYNLYIRGHYLFTNPKLVDDGGDFKYIADGEPTVLVGKDYCNFIGIDKEQAVIEVRFADNLTESDFPIINGVQKSFSDYQPAYILQQSNVKNISFIGTNTRYVMHLEDDSQHDHLDITLENCKFIRNYGWQGRQGIVVFGEVPASTFRFKNCTFASYGDMRFIGGHTPLNNVGNDKECCKIFVENCTFIGNGNVSYLGTYHYNRQDVVNFFNCRFPEFVRIYISSDPSVKRELGTLVDYNIDSPAIAVYKGISGYGLRIKTTTGASSSVRIDKTCSAFAIFGNAQDDTIVPTEWGATKLFGYEYKDDSYGSHAYACGWKNIEPTTGNSLGTILGDCSQTAKQLVLTINGTDYTVTFNTNLTSESNENIIAMINAVIGSVATCDTYNPEEQQYPHFKDIEYKCQSNDDTVIEKGMGVVIIGVDEDIRHNYIIRKAKNSDGYIDGIAIDTIYKGQNGRILKNGVMYNKADGEGLTYFSIYPVQGVSIENRIAIDTDNDGQFVVSNTNPVLKAIDYDKVMILCQ
jgi:hypothetical protein